MLLIVHFNLCIILIIIGQVSGVSFNQPKFCPNASWNPNATTFANITMVGTNPYDIFINTNNTVYAVNKQYGRVVVWSSGNTTPTRIISNNIGTPWGLFVTTAGDIYVDSDNLTGRVVKWTLNSTNEIPIMYTCKKCYDLFVDISNTLYCSMNNFHRIISTSLNNNSDALVNVAGTGASGNTAYTLNSPYGIFVDINLDLYVADYSNNRIQLFRSGQLRGTTVAGNASLTFTFPLKNPTGIVLDADGYLFIVDKGYHRVVGSGPNGYRCIVGCSGLPGATSGTLNNPYTFSFDSYGNIYVTDWTNSRIQKFILRTNSCDILTTTTTIITSTTNDVENSFHTIDSEVLLAITSPSNDVIISPLKTLSYNQPKFCPDATWNPIAVTFADNSTIGPQSYGIFINTNNSVYVINRQNGQILVWFNDSINVKGIIFSNASNARGFFVSTSGDIYVDNGYINGRVDKWSFNTNSSVTVMYIGQQCYGLFIDINDVLYCSLNSLHQVVTKSLTNNSKTLTVVAGTGCPGFTSNMLNSPYGIFVDINSNLYVADYINNRIQFFQSGQLNATTVAGNGSLNYTITLNYPTGIVLDADNNLFIVDKNRNRVVRSGPLGFQCVVGCSGTGGSAADQLNSPQIFSFDTDGNIFVTEWYNNRIQKFFVLNNSCGKSQTNQLDRKLLI